MSEPLPPSEFERKRAERTLKRLIPMLAELSDEALAGFELVADALLVATDNEMEAMRIAAELKPPNIEAVTALARGIIIKRGVDPAS